MPHVRSFPQRTNGRAGIRRPKHTGTRDEPFCSRLGNLCDVIETHAAINLYFKPVPKPGSAFGQLLNFPERAR